MATPIELIKRKLDVDCDIAIDNMTEGILHNDSLAPDYKDELLSMHIDALTIYLKELKTMRSLIKWNDNDA